MTRLAIAADSDLNGFLTAEPGLRIAVGALLDVPVNANRIGRKVGFKNVGFKMTGGVVISAVLQAD
ncbi:MAG: hypothetical protein ACRBB0_19005 [Pelagimonas sp.]|uniref:hypothetical protein n=1 Tax=Pelagimonas sp. TaxID=2073170 RepID=UPI003D6AE653